MLKINGILIKPTPQEMTVDVSDIDGESTRNARGDMVRDRIAVKRKISLKFPPLTDSQIQTILNAVSNEFFTVEYPDPVLGITTKTFYTEDRNAPFFTQDREGTCYWSGLSFNLKER